MKDGSPRIKTKEIPSRMGHGSVADLKSGGAGIPRPEIEDGFPRSGAETAKPAA
ncbi:MAG: hypothetical protein QOF78_3940 [Phycisphaerales bacterium]|jgi:hypothetical protein|nr:hypothetical protein [Phycisphaerales bacterium]